MPPLWHLLVVTFADVRYNFADAVLLQRLMFALEGYDQVVVVMWMEDHQLVPAGTDADGGDLKGST